jgi:RNA polymerase sigma-70 factor (ECF subfamily)
VVTGWAEVYRTRYKRLVAVVAVVTGSVAEAEEAVQEAFVRALGLTGRRAVVEDPEAWLYRVAVNVARSRFRRLFTAHRYAPRLAVDALPPPDEHGRVDTRIALLAALRELPFAQREALALHYLADLPIEEIAARTGAPVGTVKARLSRGRDALGRLLVHESTTAVTATEGRRDV